METNRRNFDRIDLTILRTLQRNAAQRLEDIARVTKLASSSVHERLRRLERDGVIRNWTINVDAELLGLGVLAYMGVTASKPCSELLQALGEVSAIEECHSVAGEWSLLLKVRTSSTAELLALSERLRQIPGIEGTTTTIVLKTHMDRPAPIPEIKREAGRKASR